MEVAVLLYQLALASGLQPDGLPLKSTSGSFSNGDIWDGFLDAT